jgi:hypothetical protein
VIDGSPAMFGSEDGIVRKFNGKPLTVKFTIFTEPGGSIV